MLPTSEPPVVARVVQRYAQTTQGIVGFRLHRIFDVHAGPSQRHDDLVVDEIYENGATVKVRVVTYTIGGKAAGAAARATLEQQYEHPKPTDAFKAPFDPRFVSGYQYSIAGPRTVAFTASVRDAAHGNGSFSYDAGGNVVSYSYTPSVFPEHATSGTVSDQRSQVLPGYWAVTQETQQYGGRYGLFKAGATVVLTMGSFRRFSSVAAAIAHIGSR